MVISAVVLLQQYIIGGFNDWHTITHTAGGVVIVITHPNRYSKRGGFYLQTYANQIIRNYETPK